MLNFLNFIYFTHELEVLKSIFYYMTKLNLKFSLEFSFFLLQEYTDILLNY